MYCLYQHENRLVFEPACIHDVVIGCSHKYLFLLSGNRFEQSGRIPSIDRTGGDNGVLGHNSASRNNTSSSDYRPVHNNSAHANQHFIFDCASMHHRIMRNGNVIANGSLMTLIRTMNDCAILNIAAITKRNGIDIATNDRIEPNGAVAAHSDLTNNGSVFGEPAIVAK